MDRFVATYMMNSTPRAGFRFRRRSGRCWRARRSPNLLPALAGRPALDAGGKALLSEIEALIERYRPIRRSARNWRRAHGRSETLTIDTEGRIILTETLKTHAHISDAVAFVGLGHKFQIWEPKRFRAHLVEATKKVRALRATVGNRKRGRDLSEAGG
jgi:MraZ protein